VAEQATQRRKPPSLDELVALLRDGTPLERPPVYWRPHVRPRYILEFDERGEVTRYERAPTDEECRRGWQAMMLAPTIEIYAALLRGEHVPLSSLDPQWVKRFYLRSSS
jgi:hypothetical protein